MFKLRCFSCRLYIYIYDQVSNLFEFICIWTWILNSKSILHISNRSTKHVRCYNVGHRNVLCAQDIASDVSMLSTIHFCILGISFSFELWFWWSQNFWKANKNSTPRVEVISIRLDLLTRYSTRHDSCCFSAWPIFIFWIWFLALNSNFNDLDFLES